MTAIRERLAVPVLLVLSALGAFGAGVTWMTHMHHRGLRYVPPADMGSYDSGYEQLTSYTVVPLAAAGLACGLALLVLRPRGVPLWMIVLTLCGQVFVLVARVFMWGSWAQEVRDAGSVWTSDGTLHPDYVRYMDLDWIRIAVISGYASLALVMAILAVDRRARRGSRPRTLVPMPGASTGAEMKSGRGSSPERSAADVPGAGRTGGVGRR